jgi:hypothetical protein
LRLLLSLSLPFVIGCGPGEHPRVDAEHLTFHGALDGVCEQGFVALHERELGRIEHELGRGLLDPVDVYVGLDEVEQRCPTPDLGGASSGCLVSSTEIATTLDELSLHLVAATRRQHGVDGIPFIETALPFMVGLGRPANGFVVSRSPMADPAALRPQLAYGWSDVALVDHGLGMHFLHWMEQAYGQPARHAWLWSDAVREGTHVEAAFAEATGQTIEVAEARWNVEAERDAVFGGLCHGLAAPALPAAGLQVQTPACCDAPGVEQHEPPLLNLGQRCFTVPADTMVQIELSAGEGTLVLRPDGCSASASPSPLLVETGKSVTVTMSACRWRAMVVGPERCDAAGEVRYAITPT